jgi:hypothetical protein
MRKIKYYMQYAEGDYTCSVELQTKTDGGARKLAKSIAKQDSINWYDIVYKCHDGRQGRLCNDARRWS